MKQRTYIAIDLKSFYASVECRDRDSDLPDTNLVVANGCDCEEAPSQIEQVKIDVTLLITHRYRYRLSDIEEACRV